MITFLSNSLLTTVQDLGRDGFRALGINPGGAMDKTALRLNNILLGNDENEAGLEIYFPAPKILFESDAIIALGGADFDARIGNGKIGLWQTVQVRKGQVLSFANKHSGNMTYLSVHGGLDIEPWLNSKSTNLKAKFGGKKFEKDDAVILKSPKCEPLNSNKLSPFFVSSFLRSAKIRVIEGAEFDLLTPFSSENFLKSRFRITQNSDRMGFRLDGEPLHLLHEIDLVSSAVAFGTIQLLPNGQMIILMADHQTTGGYPRIGTVIAQDLSALAQLGTNGEIGFETVSLEEAEDLSIEFEKELDWLQMGCRLQNKR